MGLVNGMGLDDRRLVVLINALLIVTMAVVDSKPLRERARRMDVHLDVIHVDDAALVADLERRLGGKVVRHEVNDIDYVRDTMEVDVRYRVWKPVARPAHAPVNQGALNQAVPNQPGPAAAAAQPQLIGCGVDEHTVVVNR